jgi:DNA-binding NarL/FixJ family response regulator
MPARKRRSRERSQRRKNARDDVRRAVSTLYDGNRSKRAHFRDWNAGASRWRLLVDFTVDGARFVVACRADGDVVARLTPREREVVALVGAGESNKAISFRLGISQSTVGVLVWRAASKLGVSSRDDLARVALSKG